MLNKVTIVGRATREAEYNEYGDSAKTTFTLAVNRDYGDEADFIDVTVWNRGNYKQAVYHRDIEKGEQVLVFGSIQQSRWEDKNGNNRSKLFVNADKVVRFKPKSNVNGFEDGDPEEVDDNFDADSFDVPF